MNYIDALYEQMVAGNAGRKPASDAFDEFLKTGKAPPPGSNLVGNSTPERTDEQILNAPENPNYQVQTKNVPRIVGELPVPIEYPNQYNVQVPQSEIIRQNRNEAISDLMQEKKSLQSAVGGLSEQSYEDRNSLRSALDKMRGIDLKTYENPELDSLIKAQQQKITAEPATVPERDLASELILNLGPAVGAMFMGEAGKLSAPTAFKEGRNVFEITRKDQIERVKLLKEQSEKKLKALIDAKKSGQEGFDKAQERALKQAQYELEGAKSLSQQSAQELDKTEQRLMTLNQEISRQRGEGATDIAKMEHRKELEKNKQKRAEILSAGQKATDTAYGKEYADFITGGYASAVSNLSKIDSAIKDLESPGLRTGMIGIVPKVARDVVAPETSITQEKVESAIQEGLKQVLGAQYTEREGQQVINRAYNPRLSEAANIEKLKRFKNQVQQALDAKLRAAKYYEQNGTLKWFKGKIYNSASDFLSNEPEFEKPEENKTGLTREQKIKALKERGL